MKTQAYFPKNLTYNPQSLTYVPDKHHLLPS